MILHLDVTPFQKYGAIPVNQDSSSERSAEQSEISLTVGTSHFFRARRNTWLCNRNQMTVLSVSTDGRKFEDFYLDKPVLIAPGIHFSLSSLRGNATVLLSAEEPPEFLGNRASSDSLLLHRHIHINNLYTFFYQEKEQGFLFPGEAHPMLELTYVDRGSLHSVVDGHDILLDQGEMMLYGPDQWHMQYADIGMAPRFITISFDMEGCDLSHLYDRKIQSANAASLLGKMLREQESQGQYHEDMILNLLSSLIVTLCREEQEPVKLSRITYSYNNENAIVQRAQQYITDHVRQPLSVPVVAEGIAVSSSYLTALFHKHLNISPGEYIRRIKLQESKQLIREGTLNFTEIASALQYSTVHHFSRQFKEKFGITPTEYAKSVK